MRIKPKRYCLAVNKKTVINSIIFACQKISLLQWRFDKPPFSFSIKKQHIGLAALGGSRIERPVQPTFFDRFVIIKKILAFKAAQYTLECGFLHYIAGTILKAQEQHFFYALVLFCCLKIFFKFFSENATNSCCVGSYCAERGIEGKQPLFTLTQKGGESA